MRRYMTGLVVAVAVTAISTVAFANNQEAAERIRDGLQQSGQLQNYKIGVKYQDGTAWLGGHVCSEQQRSTALRLVLKMQGVDRVINELEVANSSPASQIASTPESAGPVLGDPDADVPRFELGENSTALYQAERVPTSFVSVPAQRTVKQSPTPARLQHQQQPTMAPRPDQRMAQRPRPMSPSRAGRPMPIGYNQQAAGMDPAYAAQGAPRAMYTPSARGGVAPARYDQPTMPNHAWPSYAAYPNYAAVTYPKQYSPTAWPYIGPFYPYPQVPLGWRKVTLEWDDGWWMLDFKDR